MRTTPLVLIVCLLAAPALAATVTREAALAAALGRLGVPLSAFAEYVATPPDRPRAPWKFSFFQTPEAASPGLCRARVARASVYADATKPAATWLRTHFWDDAYRIVGPLDGTLAATRCDGLTPLARRFDTMPSSPPSGAFRAPSARRGAEAAKLVRDAISRARAGGAMSMTVACGDPGDEACRVPRATLATFEVPQISQVRECDEQSPRCLVVNLDAGLGDLSFWEVQIETPAGGLRGGRVTMNFAVAPVAPVAPAS
jgi:hypothetical protein